MAESVGRDKQLLTLQDFLREEILTDLLPRVSSLIIGRVRGGNHSFKFCLYKLRI